MALTKDDLEQIKTIVIDASSAIRADMVTKDDLKHFATKTDLDEFATKADLQHFATKADLGRFATKSDLEQMEDRLASKADLAQMEDRLITAMNLVERDAFTQLDEHERRITKLEKKGAAA